MDPIKETRKITVKSYYQLWHSDKKMYALTDLVLPMPVAYRSIGYFALGVLLISIFNVCIPFVHGLPFLIKWVLLPVGFAKFLNTVKLDGKNPITFFVGMIRYWMNEKGCVVEGMAAPRAIPKAIALQWSACRGQEKALRYRYKKISVCWNVSRGKEK